MSRGSEYARNVSDLYSQQGQAYANAAANKASIWGNTVAKLGDFAANTVQVYSAQKQDKRLKDLFAKAAAEYQGGQGIVSQADGQRIGDAIAREKAAGTYQTPEQRTYGTRADGTPKGEGYFGALARPDGSVSSEISIGVNIDGKEVEVPTLVPTLTPDEKNWLLTHDISDPHKIPPAIVQKAADYARQRMKAGQSPFAQSGEARPAARRQSPMPTLGELINVVGPERAIKIADGLKGLQAIASPQVPFEKKMSGLRDTMLGLNALSPEMRKEFYPHARQVVLGAGLGINPADVPEQFDENWFQSIVNYGKQTPAAQGPVQVKTIGPDGKPVTKFVTPTPGESFPLPDANESNGPGLWVERDGEVIRVRENEVLPTDRRPSTEANESVGSFDSYLKGKYGPHPTPDQIVKARRDYFPQQPPVPVVIQTSEGPQLLNRGSATTTPIKTAEGKTVEPAPTADMRNRAAGRELVGKSLNALESLSTRIITKIGPAQRADAIKRGAEAVFGSDPEFRTYQDARMALAGNLAVGQQGSRPSDADIKAIWLPLVPDAYRDTSESAKMKWDLIRTMSNTPPSEGGSSTQTPTGTPDDPLGILR